MHGGRRIADQSWAVKFQGENARLTANPAIFSALRYRNYLRNNVRNLVGKFVI
jgi:hypothetical protein